MDLDIRSISFYITVETSCFQRSPFSHPFSQWHPSIVQIMTEAERFEMQINKTKKQPQNWAAKIIWLTTFLDLPEEDSAVNKQMLTSKRK